MTNDQLQLNRLRIYPFTHLRIHSLVNQIDQSMQNKPNFTKCPIEPKSFNTKDYEPRTMNCEVGKTKPNKPKLVRRRRIVSYSILKSYETDLDFWPKNPKPKLVLLALRSLPALRLVRRSCLLRQSGCEGRISEDGSLGEGGSNGTNPI
jgi:hypothetical protein